LSKPKNFFYRIDAGPLLAEVIKTPAEKRGEWVLQFALDLVSGKGTNCYSKQIISEANQFRDKKSAAGQKGMKNRWLRDNSDITNDNSDITNDNSDITNDNSDITNDNSDITKSTFDITRSSNRSSNSNKKENDKDPAKIVYAENVTMTEDQHLKLIEKCGEGLTAACIAKLSNYKSANGKKYKSDYHAILQWVIDEVKPKFQAMQPKKLEVVL